VEEKQMTAHEQHRRKFPRSQPKKKVARGDGRKRQARNRRIIIATAGRGWQQEKKDTEKRNPDPKCAMHSHIEKKS